MIHSSTADTSRRQRETADGEQSPVNRLKPFARTAGFATKRVVRPWTGASDAQIQE